ncbi:hypothetical protein D3C84_778070 [compost metagenome]
MASCSTMPSAYSSWPDLPRLASLTCVRRCMRVAFHQTKNGLSALTWRSMKLMAALVTSSSTVSMRLRVSGPVSSTLPSADALMTPRGPNFLRNSASFG